MYELRKVPFGWTHPVDEDGKYIPAHRGKFEEIVKEDWIDDDGTLTVEEKDFDGISKTASEDELLMFCLYEDHSQGTPISPAFSTKEELAKWLSHNYEVTRFDDRVKASTLLLTLLQHYDIHEDPHKYRLNPKRARFILGLFTAIDAVTSSRRKIHHSTWMEILDKGHCFSYHSYKSGRLFGFDLGCIPAKDVIMIELPEAFEEMFVAADPVDVPTAPLEQEDTVVTPD